VSAPPCPYGECDGSGFVEDEAERTVRPCRCRPQRVAQAKARSLSAVIPKRFRNASWDRPPVASMPPPLVRAVRGYADAIEQRLDAGRGLWLMGDVGTGKTTLAMLVSSAALRAGRTVAIYSLPTLIATIRRTYDEGSRQSDVELLDRLRAVDLLHLDDLGAERTSEWVLEQIYSIVNARYEEQRSIVLTTNITDRDELCTQIGARTVSRLTEMCEEIPVFGPDRRLELSA
jgi:DNA replication protein DnaC